MWVPLGPTGSIWTLRNLPSAGRRGRTDERVDVGGPGWMPTHKGSYSWSLDEGLGVLSSGGASWDPIVCKRPPSSWKRAAPGAFPQDF